MSARLTVATAARVLRQLRHDRRTLVLLLVVPTALLALVWWMFPDSSGVFDAVGPMLVGLIPLLVMFLVTSVAALRERRSGTLERLLTMPIGRLDLLLGYALAFAAVALVQSTLAVLVAVLLLDLHVAGSVVLLIVIAVANAVLGVALGLLVSAFARTEFQAVQFMPIVILPQFLLCGFVVPRPQLPRVLEWISNVLPLSYSVDAARQVTASAALSSTVWIDAAVVVGSIVVALGLGALTLRRRTP